MSDDFGFGDAARQARSAMTDAAARKLAEQQEAKRLESERMERARNAIENDVLPILAQAKHSFEAEGIGVEIASNESVGKSTRQPIWYASFRCYLPSATRRFTDADQTVRFEHDGSTLSFFESDASQWASGRTGAAPDLVVDGVKLALARFQSRGR